jgi:DNA polymerase
MPHPDWSGLMRAGLGKIALHHAAIARPERILLFGNDVLALLGNNPAQNPAFLLNLNHQGRSVPALAARSLEHMLNIPSARLRFWRDWLDWTDG